MTLKTPETLNAVLFEQVKTLYRQSSSTFSGTMLAAAVATIVLQPTSQNQGLVQGHNLTAAMLLTWFLAVVLLTAFRFYRVRRFFRQVAVAPDLTADALTTGRVAREFAAGSFLSGCLWGVLGLMAFNAQATVPTLFLGFLLGGMVSGALGSLSVYYPAFVAYSIPSVLPFVFRSLGEGSTEYAGFGLLTLVFMLVCLGYGRGLNRTVRNSIELRFENAQLVRDLAAARDRAELASADKTALLAAATHDLRQPAYAAGLFALGLKSALPAAFAASGTALSDEAQHAQRLAGQLEASIATFNGLLEGLLDLSQLDAGGTSFVACPVNAKQVLDGVANTLVATAAQRQISLRVHAHPELWALAAPDALQRIVSNFTSNAIKFSSGCDVLLFARQQRGQVRFGVIDAGPGIAKSEHAKLFDEFVRLPQNRDDAGLGLGLAIVKRLATQMGAPVSVVSAPGHSSIFSVCLPQVAAPDAQHILQPPALADVPDLKNWLVLILDDDTMARAATVSVAQSLGWAVQPLASAQDAFDWLAQSVGDPLAADRKHLLVTDLHLNDAAGRDGLTVLDAYRQRFAGLRSVVVTGETAAAQLQRIAQSGVTVVRKPCQPQALHQALYAAVAD